MLVREQLGLWLFKTLQWRHNVGDSVTGVTGLCAGNSPETDLYMYNADFRENDMMFTTDHMFFEFWPPYSGL